MSLRKKGKVRPKVNEEFTISSPSQFRKDESEKEGGSNLEALEALKVAGGRVRVGEKGERGEDGRDDVCVSKEGICVGDVAEGENAQSLRLTLLALSELVSYDSHL
jgi:hypothetical protein